MRTWRRPVYISTRGSFFVSLLLRLIFTFNFYFCIAFSNLTAFTLLILCSAYLVISFDATWVYLFLVFCIFIFRIYPFFFGAFAVTPVGTINSIAGGFLRLSLCCFVCTYFYNRNISYSAERSDREYKGNFIINVKQSGLADLSRFCLTRLKP